MSAFVRQRDLTIVKSIDADSLEKRYPEIPDEAGRLLEFESGLREYGDTVQELMQMDPGLEFRDGPPGLHFLSVSIIPALDTRDCAQIVVELSFDGRRIRFLRRLIAMDEAADDEGFITKIFGLCPGFAGNQPRDSSATSFVTRWWRRLKCLLWLWRDSVRSTFYNGHIGLSRQRILDENDLRRRVAEFAADLQSVATSRGQVWEAITAEFGNEPIVRRQARLPLRVRVFQRDFRDKWLFRLWLATKIVILVVGIVVTALLLRDTVSSIRQPDFAISIDFCIRIGLLLVVPVLLGVLAALAWFGEYPADVKKPGRIGVLARAAWKGLVVTIIVAAILGFIALVFMYLWEPATLLVFATLLLFVALTLATAVLVSMSRIIGALAAAVVIALTLVFVVYPWFVIFNETVQPDAIHYAKLWVLFTTMVVILPVVLIITRFIEVRREEQHDKERVVTLKQVPMNFRRRRENKQIHSHFAAVATLKHGGPRCVGTDFRINTLRFMLRIIKLVHRFYLTQGWLGTISSIHFARWIIQDNERMIFLTNYDGGFAAYLGVFSENRGTTGVFGHIKGFPRPYFLLWDGARREQQFIDFARYQQVESLVWYSAYPNTTVMDIARAAQLCRSLRRPMENKETGLIADLRRARNWPVTEEEVSEILRTMLSISNMSI